MSRQEPKQDHQGGSAEHGRDLSERFLQQDVEQSAGKRGAGVYMFHKYVGGFACQDITQDTAAHSGYGLSLIHS